MCTENTVYDILASYTCLGVVQGCVAVHVCHYHHCSYIATQQELCITMNLIIDRHYSTANVLHSSPAVQISSAALPLTRTVYMHPLRYGLFMTLTVHT